MRNVMAATALASSLIFAAALTAHAAPSFNLKSATGATGSGLVELARSGGGGGHGGGHGGGMKSGGRGGMSGLSGGRMGRSSMDGGRRFSDRSGGNFTGRAISGGNKGGKFTGRAISGGGNKGGKFTGRGNGGGGKYAGRHGGNPSAYRRDGKGRSHAGHNKHYYGSNYRHRRYYNNYAGGAFFYGNYDDCSWLLYRARQTGSPYWWSRYQACVY